MLRGNFLACQEYGDPLTNPRYGMIDDTYPAALADLISREDWQEITRQFDGFWQPVVNESMETSALAPCLCLCCLCTCGLTLLGLCCLVSAKNQKLDGMRKEAR